MFTPATSQMSGVMFLSDNKQDSADSAKWFCINCEKTFVTEEEAKEHWAKSCKYGGYNAPINDIIRPISELKKRRV